MLVSGDNITLGQDTSKPGVWQTTVLCGQHARIPELQSLNVLLQHSLSRHSGVC